MLFPQDECNDQVDNTGLSNANTKSLAKRKCAHIFLNNLEFSNFIPTVTNSQAGQALTELFQDVGI
jgi:hypothetical protein